MRTSMLVLFFASTALTGCAWSNAYSAHGAIAEAQCNRAWLCEDSYPGDAPHSFESLYGESLADCYTRLSPDPADEDRYKDAEKEGRVVYDKAAAKACVGFLEAGSCDDFFANPFAGDCEAPFEGTVETGASCRIDVECVSGFCRDGACN